MPNPERLLVRVEAGLVSADVEDAPLSEVLGEIATRAGIKVRLEGSRPEKISARFDSVPLDEALRRLIKENFLLLYSSGPGGELAEVWVGDARTRFSAGSSGETRVQESQGERVELGAGVAPEHELEDQRDHVLSSRSSEMESLLQELREGDASQRRWAVWALGDHHDERARDALTAALRGDDDAEVRVRAAWLLEFNGGREAVGALTDAASSDRDESVRQRALQTLATVGGQLAVGALSSALRDPSPSVRYEALTDLHEIGGDAARASVLRALRDPDQMVRDKAAELLQRRPP